MSDGKLFYFTDKVPSLDKARKDITITGQPYYDTDPASISEWQFSYAKMQADGKGITIEEFGNLIKEATFRQSLNELCEKGYIELIFEDDEEKYRITEKGRQYMKNFDLKNL